MAAPIIPAVNDGEIETILTRAYAAGAREAGYVALRLPLELRESFREWLAVNFPDKLKRAITLTQSMHGGKDYEFAMGPPHGGLGPLRLDDRPPLRNRRQASRLSRDAAVAAQRPLPRAGACRGGRAAATCRCSENRRHREERSDEAIQRVKGLSPTKAGLLRFARNDGVRDRCHPAGLSSPPARARPAGFRACAACASRSPT